MMSENENKPAVGATPVTTDASQAAKPVEFQSAKEPATVDKADVASHPEDDDPASLSGDDID